MRREGFEPSTFGLRVQPRRLQRTVTDGICLQLVAFSTATNCNELQPAETGRYAHRTLTRPLFVSDERTLAHVSLSSDEGLLGLGWVPERTESDAAHRLDVVEE